MLLKLQKYNLQVQYKKGAEMHTAYFLSRTFTDNNDRKKKTTAGCINKSSRWYGHLGNRGHGMQVGALEFNKSF